MVLESTTVEDDPEKGPSNDLLESSDSSKVSSKQGWNEQNLAVCFTWRRHLATSGAKKSSRRIPLEPPPLPHFWVAFAIWALPAAMQGDFKAISG